ncbi:HFL071Cp [Eremothecium sinecaudum]|uniref:HFL071Cp n=1 Tax=Eremothecium sinecaudum TaxID=45286 RepID=A0A0X8HUS7_9SACH|nr:HFL071Cp [Eremothecium sinecaudum]AMD21785.1 HFL071Cp [Eremothecium sinecaudum]
MSSNPTKKRHYAQLSQQLQLLQKNLEATANHVETMSTQCNEYLVNKLGKIQASWFIGGNRCFEQEMLGKH